MSAGAQPGAGPECTERTAMAWAGMAIAAHAFSAGSEGSRDRNIERVMGAGKGGSEGVAAGLRASRLAQMINE